MFYILHFEKRKGYFFAINKARSQFWCFLFLTPLFHCLTEKGKKEEMQKVFAHFLPFIRPFYFWLVCFAWVCKVDQCPIAQPPFFCSFVGWKSLKRWPWLALHRKGQNQPNTIRFLSNFATLQFLRKQNCNNLVSIGIWWRKTYTLWYLRSRLTVGLTTRLLVSNITK